MTLKMRHTGSELTVEEACVRLGLTPEAPVSDLQGAFQRALRQARGGAEHVSPDQYRDILDAYRCLRLRAPETPSGPCSFRLSAEAIEVGLARAPGLGLPPSRGHAQGDLYVKLIADRRATVAAEIIKRITRAA